MSENVKNFFVNYTIFVMIVTVWVLSLTCGFQAYVFASQIMSITNIFVWVLSAVSLSKILVSKNEEWFQILFAWLPILNFIPISKLINTGFWSVFLATSLCSLSANSMLMLLVFFTNNSISNYAALFILITILLNAIPVWFIWHQIAENGGHTKFHLLGYLSGIPLISFVALPYIAWTGKWTNQDTVRM